jgi:hypothetical protein
MTDPFNKDSDKVKYWQHKFESEFDRARSYEMDIVHYEYRIKQLQQEVELLKADNRLLHEELNKAEAR